MTMFTTDYIKRLFTFNFPTCCSDWNDPDGNDTINNYGSLLKSFVSVTNNIDEQMIHARKINHALNTNYNDFELCTMVDTYNQIKQRRKQAIKDAVASSCCSWCNSLTSVPNLSADNDEVWGSKRQYMYGHICSDIMKQHNIVLSPFLCSALNPTGGICGPGNTSLYTGMVNDPMIVHSCMHDASGYCYNYHNIGLGYNYLNTWFALPTHMPMSCQIMGIWTCSDVKKNINDTN
jgi:hypothetical protein